MDESTSPCIIEKAIQPTWGSVKYVMQLKKCCLIFHQNHAHLNPVSVIRSPPSPHGATIIPLFSVYFQSHIVCVVSAHFTFSESEHTPETKGDSTFEAVLPRAATRCHRPRLKQL